jgi:hypothetical protein
MPPEGDRNVFDLDGLRASVIVQTEILSGKISPRQNIL